MHRTTIRGQIGGLLIRIPEQPKQIIRKLGGHVIDINPNRHRRRWVERILVNTLILHLPNQIIQLPDALFVGITDSIVPSRARQLGELGCQKMLERCDERVLEIRVRVRVSK